MHNPISKLDRDVVKLHTKLNSFPFYIIKGFGNIILNKMKGLLPLVLNIVWTEDQLLGSDNIIVDISSFNESRLVRAN